MITGFRPPSMMTRDLTHFGRETLARVVGPPWEGRGEKRAVRDYALG